MVRKILPMLLVLIGLSLAGCGEYGKVEQGRVVKYDETKTPHQVWIIQDSAIDDKNSKYDVLPAHAFDIPSDAGEMGAKPRTGDLVYMNLEGDKPYVTMFYFGNSVQENRFDRVPVKVVEHTEGVSVRRRHPLVWDAEKRSQRTFPIVNAEKREVTIFFQRQSTVTTLHIIDEEDFARYKPEEWTAGDEVRIYFKEVVNGIGKSLRLMNVTRTDINARG